jgi:hypothetical protein
MRDMLFSPSIFTPPKISDADSKSAIDTKSVREVLIPVFLSLKKRGKDDKVQFLPLRTPSYLDSKIRNSSLAEFWNQETFAA